MAELTSNTSNISSRSVGILTIYPGAPVDWNSLINARWYRSGYGLVAGSEGVFAPNLSGNTSNITLASVGIFIEAELLSSNTSNITAASISNMYLDPIKSNWVKWSDIGSFSFVMDRKNVAGEMPLDWQGEVYSVMKLYDTVMVYGSGGVSQLIPKDVIFGLNTLSKVGIKSRFSVTGDASLHMFIDKENRLCRLDKTISILGYAEYLSPMTNPVLNVDNLNGIVYICDGTYGYVYSLADKSLGSGPVNITGIEYSDDELYVITSGPVTMPTLEIVTDILDFNNRKDKTVHELEVGTNLTGSLEASVDFSLSTAGTFTSSGWKPVTPDGIAYIHCFGKEFRVRLRCTTNVAIELDYMRIRGVTHRYNPLDS